MSSKMWVRCTSLLTFSSKDIRAPNMWQPLVEVRVGEKKTSKCAESYFSWNASGYQLEEPFTSLETKTLALGKNCLPLKGLPRCKGCLTACSACRFTGNNAVGLEDEKLELKGSRFTRNVTKLGSGFAFITLLENLIMESSPKIDNSLRSSLARKFLVTKGEKTRTCSISNQKRYIYRSKKYFFLILEKMLR